MKTKSARCWPFISLMFLMVAHQAPAQDQLSTGRRVLVLHSYLLPPSWAQQIEDASATNAVRVNFAAADSMAPAEIEGLIADADLVLLDVAHESVFEGVAGKSSGPLQRAGCPYVYIGDLDSVRGDRQPEVAKEMDGEGVSNKFAQIVRRYYRFGGAANLKHLVKALAVDPNLESYLEAPEPVMIPERGFYHPGWPQIESELAAVQSRLDSGSQPVVAIAINRATVSACDTAWLDALIDALRSRGLSSYAFYGPRQEPDRFTRMTCRVGDARVEPIVDLIINSVLVFRPQDRKQELDRIGVPVLQTMPSMNRSLSQWRQSADGLPLADISYYYASSELAGMVDPVLLSARHAEKKSLDPIAMQVDGIADRAAAFIRLRATSTDQRRVAVFVYNYPPGENNFGASFLNVPKSLENAFRALRDAGYGTETPKAEALIDRLQGCLRGLYDKRELAALIDRGEADFVLLEEYEAWLREIPAATRQRIVDYWGTPDSTAISLKQYGGAKGFVIPRVSLGNVVVLPQPLRHELTTSTEPDLRRKRINHQSVVPLSHQYFATYLYVKRSFEAHAVVHFGTHGTQEWAPGKRRALAMDDEAMLAIGSVPNIYPYIMDNLGEATTAKRRGRATMVSHLTPMFTPAGFRPGLHDMHVIMHDWETVDPGPVKKEIERQLIEEFVKHQLDKDVGWSPERIAVDFPGFMEVLHPFLDDIAQSAQPQGLAVFGAIPSEERRFGMVMQILRTRLIDALGEDIDEVFLIDADKVKNSRPARWLRLALSDPESASKLDLREIDRLDTSRHNSVPNRAEDKQLDQDELLALAKEAQRLNRVLSSNSEMDALLKALDGGHIPSGYGGDPVRNPDSLPTGRNLYGFDPVRVPTAQSWKIGVGVLEDWIANYRVEHEDAFPTQIAFTLWAGETMRHHGVMESQVFHALGVQPTWDASGRMDGFDVIPSEELGRPRIDVLANVTGSYRDQFPHLMRWIDKAVVAVAGIEPSAEADSAEARHPNFVSQHAKSLMEDLVSQGLEPETARRRATARVFSNESGTYGTGLNNAVYHSDLWETQDRGGGDAEMTELFLHRMGHAYGEGLDGLEAADLFARQIEQLDAVFLSRSSNTYGVLTSDDPFAYLGGFALASRMIRGDAPELAVQNLRDSSEVIIDPVATAIAKEMQTRYLHPQWIKTQQQEGYSGTLQVLKATQFLWGWQAMSPDAVRSDQWQALMDVYIEDQYDLGTRAWFEQSNHQALAQMAERMIEAIRLNYWTPSLETQQSLARVYRQAVEASGLMEKNRMVAAFVEETYPDLDSDPLSEGSLVSDPTMQTPNARSDAPSATTQTGTLPSDSTDTAVVRGLELVPKETALLSESDSARPQRWTFIIVIGLVFIGAIVRLLRFAAKKGSRG
ncbi:MAG: cobaltochelatase subunit CobN [Planctomycetota bacterium]